MELQIKRLGIYGEGVAHHEGYTLFVDGALPGETIEAEVYERRKNFGRAEIKNFITSSPFRQKPICPLFGKCGGCQLMHLDYEKQLEAKRQRVVDAFERIGKLSDIEVLSCRPSPLPLGYRNKIQLPIKNSRLGLYAKNTHDVVPIKQCFIHSDLGEKVFSCLQKLLASALGLKHALIKTALHTNQALVILVTEQKESPWLKVLASQLMKEVPEIKGVVQNVNSANSNTILSDSFHTLAGQGWIEEKLLGLTFRVSPSSFFQVNPLQAEQLYQKVASCCALQKKEKVLDAYCGVGTLSLILARQAKEVIGIEYSADAIEDANKNAAQNQITNATFICADVTQAISSLENIDVAVLNPPRKGCDPSFLENLVKLQPKRLVYVSCDPATLARDLSILCEQGYQIDFAEPFDMFPQTAHVECLVQVSLKNSLKKRNIHGNH